MQDSAINVGKEVGCKVEASSNFAKDAGASTRVSSRNRCAIGSHFGNQRVASSTIVFL
jgi:hypothetical protein